MKTIKHRLILPMQAKGNMGKSIEAATRPCWLNQRNILWQGFDLDGDNRTLSRLFPDQVKLIPLTGQADDLDELISILRKTTVKPVTLIDPRAHLDGQLMKALAATHFFDIAGAQNIGITLMVFPFDDLDVMTNLDAVCQFCGQQVDYVIVRNPARASKTRMFDNSPLEKELFDLGAATITVSVLSEFVKIRLARLEAEQQRGIPFNEAIGSDKLGLDIMARGVLQDWLATMFSQYDQIAAKLLPAVEAASIKPKIVPPINHSLFHAVDNAVAQNHFEIDDRGIGRLNSSCKDTSKDTITSKPEKSEPSQNRIGGSDFLTDFVAARPSWTALLVRGGRPMVL